MKGKNERRTDGVNPCETDIKDSETAKVLNAGNALVEVGNKQVAQNGNNALITVDNSNVQAKSDEMELMNAEDTEIVKRHKRMSEQRLFGGRPLTLREQRLRLALSFALMTLGVIMMSISVYFFQVPNGFTFGGVAGMAIVLSKIIQVKWLSQGVIMTIINVFLLILGLIILGKQCTIKTIYCSLLYTGVIWLFEFLDILGKITGIPTPVGGTPATITNGDPFLEFIYMIFFFGVGAALVFNCGASTGGTDIIALILKKFTHLNVGMALMIIDLLVVCASIFVFESLTIALYSFMALIAKSFLLDGVIESMVRTKYITIITTKPDEISKYILEVIQHGCTQYEGKGAYTKEAKSILITICRRSEAMRLKQQVKELDPDAFVIITDANEILGKGFGGTI